MPAFETLAGAAKQYRPWRHQLAARGRGAVLKASRDNHRDGHTRVPLFKGVIVRARGTDHILHAPAFALSQLARSRIPWPAVQSALC